MNNEKVEVLMKQSSGKKSKLGEKENLRINSYYDNVLNSKNLLTINLQNLINSAPENKS